MIFYHKSILGGTKDIVSPLVQSLGGHVPSSPPETRSLGLWHAWTKVDAVHAMANRAQAFGHYLSKFRHCLHISGYFHLIYLFANRVKLFTAYCMKCCFTLKKNQEFTTKFFPNNFENRFM